MFFIVKNGVMTRKECTHTKDDDNRTYMCWESYKEDVHTIGMVITVLVFIISIFFATLLVLSINLHVLLLITLTSEID